MLLLKVVDEESTSDIEYFLKGQQELKVDLLQCHPIAYLILLESYSLGCGSMARLRNSLMWCQESSWAKPS